MEISDDDVVPIPEVIVRSVESSLVQFTLTFIYEPYIHWELYNSLSLSKQIFNPRRTCTRVTVLGLQLLTVEAWEAKIYG